MFLFTFFFFFLVFNWLADVRFLAFVFPQEHYKIIIIKNKSPPSNNIILPPSWSTLQPLADKYLPFHTHTMYTVQGLKQHVRTDPQSRPKPGFQSTAHHLWDTWKCTKDALGHSLMHIFWMVRVCLYPGRLQCSAARRQSRKAALSRLDGEVEMTVNSDHTCKDTCSKRSWQLPSAPLCGAQPPIVDL